ncbi:MAG: hypothetical protein IT503_21390 [Burkholderiaceae bacterium]|nr:hypothetical protein [Ideonella sp.]MCC7288740.1 hypothetical protein [Burkholderiaceae bacterium]
MQQTRKTSLLKTLFAGKRAAAAEPKKALQPLEPHQLAQVAGGQGSPKGGW